MELVCDRCGREMNGRWEIEGMPGTGGCCDDGCGDNLCAECANWDVHEYCKLCAMSLEELEFLLPISVQHEGKKEPYCAGCTRNMDITVTYEQRLWRSDCYALNNKKRRSYEISYRRSSAVPSTADILFTTERHNNLRDVLADAYKMLFRLGLMPEKNE